MEVFALFRVEPVLIARPKAILAGLSLLALIVVLVLLSA